MLFHEDGQDARAPRRESDASQSFITLSRWNKGLVEVSAKVKGAMPSDWKAKAVDSADEPWIKEHICTRVFLSRLGQDNNHAKHWLDSMNLPKKALLGK